MSETWHMPNVPAPVTADHCEVDCSEGGHVYINCTVDDCKWSHDLGWITDLGELTATWLGHLEAVHRA